MFIISSSHGEGLRIAGLCVMESIPFIISEKSGPDNNFKFKLWRSPDQIRAMIAGGQTDGAIITHNEISQIVSDFFTLSGGKLKSSSL